MLQMNRRHTRECQKKFPGLSWLSLKRCKCPLVVTGTDAHGEYRNHEALHTTDLIAGAELLRKIELGESIIANDLTVHGAVQQFLTILTTQRGIKPISLESYRTTTGSLLKFANHRGVRLFRQIDQAFMDEWIATWEIADSTRIGRFSFVRRFFDAALRRKWITEDPTLALVTPKAASHGSTNPFELRTELPKLMTALTHWEDAIVNKRAHKSVWSSNPRTAAALIATLRWTGLRISDAILFDPKSLVKMTVEGQEAYCFYAKAQRKTESPVFVPIMPADAVPILSAPRLTDRWAFWDGETDQRTFSRRFISDCLEYLERASGVEHIHPHRFRDTFAVDLLSRGADIRSVSRLLGHKNVATTLRYYEHWISADQERLVRTIMKGRNVVEFKHKEG